LTSYVIKILKFAAQSYIFFPNVCHRQHRCVFQRKEKKSMLFFFLSFFIYHNNENDPFLLSTYFYSNFKKNLSKDKWMNEFELFRIELVIMSQ